MKPRNKRNRNCGAVTEVDLVTSSDSDSNTEPIHKKAIAAEAEAQQIEKQNDEGNLDNELLISDIMNTSADVLESILPKWLEDNFNENNNYVEDGSLSTTAHLAFDLGHSESLHLIDSNVFDEVLQDILQGDDPADTDFSQITILPMQDENEWNFEVLDSFTPITDPTSTNNNKWNSNSDSSNVNVMLEHLSAPPTKSISTSKKDLLPQSLPRKENKITVANVARKSCSKDRKKAPPRHHSHSDHENRNQNHQQPGPGVHHPVLTFLNAKDFKSKSEYRNEPSTSHASTGTSATGDTAWCLRSKTKQFTQPNETPKVKRPFMFTCPRLPKETHDEYVRIRTLVKEIEDRNQDKSFFEILLPQKQGCPLIIERNNRFFLERPIKYFKQTRSRRSCLFASTSASPSASVSPTVTVSGGTAGEGEFTAKSEKLRHFKYKSPFLNQSSSPNSTSTSSSDTEFEHQFPNQNKKLPTTVGPGAASSGSEPEIMIISNTKTKMKMTKPKRKSTNYEDPNLNYSKLHLNLDCKKSRLDDHNHNIPHNSKSVPKLNSKRTFNPKTASGSTGKPPALKVLKKIRTEEELELELTLKNSQNNRIKTFHNKKGPIQTPTPLKLIATPTPAVSAEVAHEIYEVDDSSSSSSGSSVLILGRYRKNHNEQQEVINVLDSDSNSNSN